MLTETLDGALNKTMTYDASGRFVLGENGDGDTTEYTYNALGYRVENTTTRQNPNFAYQNSAISAGSAYIGDVEADIAALQTTDAWSYFDETGKVVQRETEVTTKSYTVDFTTGGLRDIMVAEDGMFTQTYSYGLGLISVDTTIDASAEASVQQVIATEYNAHYFAHQNRLGGISYYTDGDGKLLQYNEFDAWGNAYTAEPDDVNHSGLNNGLGFTGYTWDAVLGVWFSQARMYDAGSKRFLSADPIGGSVLKPVLFNAYLYCASDPVNNIDPTGMYMPGDENLNLTPEQTAAIEVLSDAWFAATDQAGRDAAHAAANAVRNGLGVNNDPNVQNPGSYGFVTDFPPTAWDIVFGAIAVTNPALSLDEVYKNAKQWVDASIAKNYQDPMYPLNAFTYYDITSLRSTNAGSVTIVEGPNDIVIYAYVRVNGSAADITVPGRAYTTYRDLAVRGIINNWDGEFEGKTVSVRVVDTSDGQEHQYMSGQKRFDISIIDEFGKSNVPWWWSSIGNPAKITMYIGDDENNPPLYSAQMFMETVGHEFGHILGLKDVYTDVPEERGGNRGFTSSGRPISIMNSQFDLGGAQDIDYAMAFRSHRNNGNMLWYSENTDILDEYGVKYTLARGSL